MPLKTIIDAVDQMHTWADEARSTKMKIGLVPTMGFLHQGHLSLVKKARDKADQVVVSIFVNPGQFEPNEDFEDYPRDFERDVTLIGKAGGDVIFAPSVEEIYPEGFSTYVKVEKLTAGLCAVSRPSHFQGVTIVVIKLLCCVKPHFAVFGQKDAQQAFVIKRMVQDLNMDVEIVVCPTVRAEDGIAMSSRNMYLSHQEREDATILFKSLQRARKMIGEGQREADKIIKVMKDMIEEQRTARVDYVSIVDTLNLKEIDTIEGEVLIALAVWFGSARLIDNAIVSV